MTDPEIGELDAALQLAKRRVSLACLRSSPDAWQLVGKALSEIEAVRKALWTFRVSRVVQEEREVGEHHPDGLRASESAKTPEKRVCEAEK